MSDLPGDLDASLFIVHHFPQYRKSALAAILSRSGKLPAIMAEDGMPIDKGRIYVAPSDLHMILEAKKIRCILAPKENSCRPAVDPLFRSAATTFRERVIGVILTGMLNDGASGPRAIKAARGVAVVQDPATAAHPGMPESAIQAVHVDFVAPIDEMGKVLVGLVSGNLATRPQIADKGLAELAAAEVGMLECAPTPSALYDHRAQRSVYTCPECHGIMWEFSEGGLVRYRCHVGHAFTAESLLEEQSLGLESALWSAIRALEEHADLLKRLGDRADAGGLKQSSAHFRERENASRQRSQLLRNTFLGNSDSPTRVETEEDFEGGDGTERRQA